MYDNGISYYLFMYKSINQSTIFIFFKEFGLKLLYILFLLYYFEANFIF